MKIVDYPWISHTLSTKINSVTEKNAGSQSETEPLTY